SEAAASGAFTFSSLEFIRYFLAVFFVRQFTVVWVIWEFERDVVEGKLSPKLLHPLDPVWHHFFSHFAERFARLPFFMMVIGLFFLAYPEAFWVPDLSHFLLAMVTILIAFALRFLIQYTLAMLAFWTERASSIENFWLLFYFFLSGMIAPLEIFPPTIRTVVEYLPFAYFIHFPASLLMGLPTNIPRSFAIMALWTLVFLGINRCLWRRGLRHYSGMGA
ncbi:MAG: multidrug ABC transporter permease, partial [Merismopedia sp. SIO2A8]|nr:multidrug ABC transporter permease [Merismopedia sp. SIO2A8]